MDGGCLTARVKSKMRVISSTVLPVVTHEGVADSGVEAHKGEGANGDAA